ncbi:hypothetical protein HF1_05180 [Mycoplasma haemofelis str. Langford 1]|uniref:Uncharacterized protein n=1 Tax=Mycoplasma haemofelis (strain Langford 1) TaxID=941640 RepID=E8ZHA5_MYCHL|nr:hypothetical protein HF1_05180 [Mycoplasma haemofelis str. Langford 1]
MTTNKWLKIGGPTVTGIGGIIATSSLVSKSAEEKPEEKVRTKSLTDEDPLIGRLKGSRWKRTGRITRRWFGRIWRVSRSNPRSIWRRRARWRRRIWCWGRRRCFIGWRFRINVLSRGWAGK